MRRAQRDLRPDKNETRWRAGGVALCSNDLTGIAQTKNPALAFTALTNVPLAVLGNSSFPKAMIQ
jgi:hypothetical protein